jgi:hypothetical protein
MQHCPTYPWATIPLPLNSQAHCICHFSVDNLANSVNPLGLGFLLNFPDVGIRRVCTVDKHGLVRLVKCLPASSPYLQAQSRRRAMPKKGLDMAGLTCLSGLMHCVVSIHREALCQGLLHSRCNQGVAQSILQFVLMVIVLITNETVAAALLNTILLL